MDRPLLHLTPAEGWLNDPHGVTFHDGRYHLFHQYVPDSLAWAPGCHWGHAVGEDLLHWEHRPVALAPGDGDDGIWTGALVTDGEDATILYTSVAEPDLGMGRIRAAHPDDAAWDTWTKGRVVVEPPTDLGLIAFRDPFVTREDDHWRMLVGGATGDGTAIALTWTSADLEAWRYDGVAVSRSTLEREPVWTGSLWECPQVFEVDGHWALVTSVWDDHVLHHAGYGLGTYAEGRFTASTWGQLSFGGSYYAPSFFRDAIGRPCLVFWMRGVAGETWTGCLSVPYLLSVSGGRLVAEPHPDVTAARGDRAEPGPDRAIDLGAGAVDVEWQPDPGGDDLVLRAGSVTCARVVAADGTLSLERPDHETWSMPWRGGPVRVVVDGPALELCSDDGVLGGAVVPPDALHPGVGSLTAWALK